MAAGVVSRVKIMADLDIAERRLPQDGRFGLVVDGHHVDLRVVTLPSVHGESIVMRILDKDSVVMKLDKLGCDDVERERFEHAFHADPRRRARHRPDGLGQVDHAVRGAARCSTRPRRTSSRSRTPSSTSSTGITQVQVAPKAGLTFATGLRAMVRADPDVIMVGEIRDRETAQIAVESALTGHLVLSTLHTNDAPSAITRLTEMGIEPFLVASAIDCVVAQRLARTLCPQCKQRTIVPADVLRENGYKALVDLEAYEPVGCRRCGGTGYRGRIGLYEVMTRHPGDPHARARAPLGGGDPRGGGARRGCAACATTASRRSSQGRTSIAEVARVIGTTDMRRRSGTRCSPAAYAAWATVVSSSRRSSDGPQQADAAE